MKNKKMTKGETLLMAIGVCGELPADLVGRVVGSASYAAALVTKLKEEKQISCRSGDGIKGYVLRKKGTETLLMRFPEQMQPFGDKDTGQNRIKSDPDKRLRLHRMAYAWVGMYGFGAAVFPGQFPAEKETYCPSVLVKRKIAREAMGSRACGILDAGDHGFCVYHTMESLLKWNQRTEWTFRLRAAQSLYGAGEESRLQAIILAEDMRMLERILRSDGGIKKELFYPDDVYESYFYLPTFGNAKLQYRFLVDAVSEQKLKKRIAGLVLPGEEPAIFCWRLDLWQLRRTADRILRNGKRTVICLDYQVKALQDYLGSEALVLGLKPEKISSILNQEGGDPDE